MNLLSTTVAVAIGICVASLTHAQTVGIATTPAGSFTNSAGTAIATVAVEQQGLQARIQPQAGNQEQAVNAGVVEFGIDNYFNTYFAKQGIEDHEGNPKVENIMAAANLIPLSIAFFVRADSGIQTVADLKGRRISSGYGAQKAADRNVRMYLAAAGLTYDDVITLPAQNVIAAADDFKAGRTDAFNFALGTAKVQEVSASVGGLRLLTVSDSPEAVAAAQELVPGAYPVKVQPGPAMVGVDKPTTVYAMDLFMFVNKDTDDDAVYKMVRAMHDGQSTMGEIFPPLQAMDPDMMVKPFQGFDYHPGARKFYEEAGIWPSE